MFYSLSKILHDEFLVFLSFFLLTYFYFSHKRDKDIYHEKTKRRQTKSLLIAAFIGGSD